MSHSRKSNRPGKRSRVTHFQNAEGNLRPGWRRLKESRWTGWRADDRVE